MALKLFLLCLPTLVVANIAVYLSGKFKGDMTSELKLSFNGDDVGLITDTERSTYNITDEGLIHAVISCFGKRPTAAYLRSPAHDVELYKKYSWAQVTRTLRPVSAKILKISSKPYVIYQKVFKNNELFPASINVGFSQELYNTVSSTWSKGGELSISQNINYDMNLDVVEVGRNTSFSYSSSWGVNTVQLQTIKLGATSSLEMNLNPGQSVITELQGTRGSIQIQIEYEAILLGQIALNYASEYKGRYFWALSIDDCMYSAGLNNQIVSKEVIDIGFYLDSKITIRDKINGSNLMEVFF